MRQRFIDLARIVARIAVLAIIALAGQAGQRWPGHY
jgi:hypothetical protein